jgi:hypothetical protein
MRTAIRSSTLSCSFLICPFLIGTASAEIIGVAGGPDAPSPTLGPYTMTPFPLDERPLLQLVSSIPSPLGGEIVFSDPVLHRRIGVAWAEWSHGYTGDVYTTGPAEEITLTMPPDTYALYFYVGHDFGALHSFTAEVDGGPSVTQSFFRSDPSYYGFYQDDPSDGPIDTITITGSMGNFAIGEFGIAVPEPGALGLLAIGALTLRRRHRRPLG